MFNILSLVAALLIISVFSILNITATPALASEFYAPHSSDVSHTKLNGVESLPQAITNQNNLPVSIIETTSATTKSVDEATNLFNQTLLFELKQLPEFEQSLVSLSKPNRNKGYRLTLSTQSLSKLNYQSFSDSLNNMNAYGTVKANANKEKYAQIFSQYAERSTANFQLQRFECGDLLCMALIGYQRESDVEVIINGSHNRIMSAFDANASIYNIDESFRENYSFAWVFSAAGSNVSAIGN